MKVSSFLVAGAMSLVMAASATAASIKVDFTKVDPRSNVSVKIVNGVSAGVNKTFSGQAGVMNFTRDTDGNSTNNGYTGPGLKKGQSFKSFCIDLIEVVGDNTVYEVGDLSKAPNPGTPLPGAGGMGTAAATNIAKLWAAYFNQAATDNTKAAALQLAIWEVVYDSASSSSSYNILTGTFLADFTGLNAAKTASLTSITSQAQTYLDALNAGSLKKVVNLKGLMSPGETGTPGSRQDQVTMVPLPTAAWMGLGLLASAAGVSYARRRSIMA